MMCEERVSNRVWSGPVAAMFVAAAALTFSTATRAASINVPNGDFEDYQAIGDGVTNSGWASFPSAANGMIADAIPLVDEFWSNPASFGSGWQSNGPQPTNGKYGLQHPNTNTQQDMNAPFNGHFIGFMNLTEGDGTGSSAGQVQSGVLGQLAEGTYTLTVAVGARPSASWNDVNYSISLVAGGLTPGDPLSNQFGTSGGTALGTPANVTLVPSTATIGSNTQDLVYTLDVLAGDPMIGSDYAIRLDLTNTGMQNGVATDLNTFTQANFDNVRLDGPGVPEPTSLALCGGAAALLLRRRKAATGRVKNV